MNAAAAIPPCAAAPARRSSLVFSAQSLILSILFLLQSHGALSSSSPLLWPHPQSISHGDATLILSQAFRFVSDGASVGGVLQAGFERQYANIFSQHHTLLRMRTDVAASASSQTKQLEALRVRLASGDEDIYLGVDESYELHVPDPNNASSALLTAETVYGALHGLETFSQLTEFNFNAQAVQLRHAPISISDRPRFSYRGLLIDTSRHYEPLRMVRDVIDSMAYAKLNVLHWHIVDEQSFPIEIPSYPNLWDGSYTGYERYTLEDAKDVVEYARLRGVNVMAELDVPGHARSWGVGYPQLWPSPTCKEPLDVTKNFTFELIEGIISDFAKVFPFKLMHLGGDEVNTSCWESSSHISEWLSQHNLTAQGAYQYFVLRAQQLAIKHGYTPVNWEETFDNFGSRLDKSTIVHNWLGPGVAPQIVKAGFKCIVSNQDVWYLDHLDVPWQSFYRNDPYANISDSEEQKLVIGGEVCMWGETVDPSDIMQTIWPRAAAAAERLWSSTSVTDEGVGEEKLVKRLKYFRCLLNQRGIAAAPVDVLGRVAPPYPGSCFDQ